MKKVVLHVGVDDSNHAGTQKNGEIVVATFSYLPSDGEIRPFVNRRNKDIVDAWERETSGQYKFTILTNFGPSQKMPSSIMNREFGTRQSNLPFAAPFLVLNFIMDQKVSGSEINLYLDGKINEHSQRGLERDFDKIGLVLKVSCFPKKNGPSRAKMKRPLCPRPVYVADYIANSLFQKNFDLLATHPNMVRIPEEAIWQYFKRERIDLSVYRQYLNNLKVTR